MIPKTTVPESAQHLERAALLSIGSGLVAVVAARSMRSLRWQVPLALIGAGFIYGGLRGRRGRRVGRAPSSDLFESQRTITVMRPAGELRDMWRRPEVLADIWRDLGELKHEDGRLRWSLRLPGGPALQFSAESVESDPDEVVWRAVPREVPRKVPGAMPKETPKETPMEAPMETPKEVARDVAREVAREVTPEDEPTPSAARERDCIRVQFRQAAADKGTEVKLCLAVVPPGGRAGVALLRALERGVDLLLDRALRRFQNLAEAGEIPTLEKNPSGRVGRAARDGRREGPAPRRGRQARAEV